HDSNLDSQGSPRRHSLPKGADGMSNHPQLSTGRTLKKRQGLRPTLHCARIAAHFAVHCDEGRPGRTDLPMSDTLTPASAPLSRHFCVAPMMDWTDRHCRFFLRQLSRHALLYTEMVTTGALLHGDRQRFLRHHPDEQPLALQLGGS